MQTETFEKGVEEINREIGSLVHAFNGIFEIASKDFLKKLGMVKH